MITKTEPLAATDEYFESVYADAQGDSSLVPWASNQPSPSLVNWLNAVAPSLIRCGSRVAIVGCGLGDDAREIIRRGYEVTAFDCSSTAVRWAQDLDPGHAVRYVQANLFKPPPSWVHRFDLVTEVSNLEFLPAGKRADAISALSRLMSPHGYLLVVCRGADHEIAPDAEPPWPLTKDSLVEAAAAAGLVPEGPVCCFTDEVATGVKRIRAVFRRR